MGKQENARVIKRYYDTLSPKFGNFNIELF